MFFVFFSIFLIFSIGNVYAQQVASDNFNSNPQNGAIAGWTNNGSAQVETYLCGSACNSVKLSDTRNSNPNGRLIQSFPVTAGATYSVNIKAGVFTGGASPDGAVTLTAVSGTAPTEVNWCGSNTCGASGSSINGSLSVSIVTQNSTLTVYLDGTQGGCDPNGDCHDPLIDDFSLTKTADPVVSASDDARCIDIKVNNGNQILAGQNYTATVTMKNDGDTTWVSSGSNPYKLGSQLPEDKTTWGTETGADSGQGTRPNRDSLSSAISSTQSKTFSFGVTTPKDSGNYRFAYRMVKEGAYWFGDTCQPNLWVSPASEAKTPSVTCSVSTNPPTDPPTANTGQSVTWAARASGGSGTGYMYSWAGSTDNLDSMTANPATLPYNTTGIKYGKVQVTDSAGNPSPITDCSNSVTIKAPVPIVTLTANPISIANNASSTLSWTTTNSPTSCTATDSWSGSKSISGGSQSTGNLPGPANYTYTLTCIIHSGDSSLPSTANVSVGGATCSAETNSAFCIRLNKNCGSVTGTDNCGITRTVASCGNCSSPLTCGGGGTVNVCGGGSCTPETNSAFCTRLNKNCGAVTGVDNCGTSRTVSSCGSCSGATPTCSAANVCVTSGGGSSILPWIQTIGGDVHSNTRIYTPGGP